jgi:hypothetical protein
VEKKSLNVFQRKNKCVCGRGDKERVWEGEYGGNAVYSCMKMEK